MVTVAACRLCLTALLHPRMPKAYIIALLLNCAFIGLQIETGEFGAMMQLELKMMV